MSPSNILASLTIQFVRESRLDCCDARTHHFWRENQAVPTEYALNTSTRKDDNELATSRSILVQQFKAVSRRKGCEREMKGCKKVKLLNFSLFKKLLVEYPIQRGSSRVSNFKAATQAVVSKGRDAAFFKKGLGAPSLFLTTRC